MNALLKFGVWIVLILTLVLFLSACSSGVAPPEPAEPHAEATLEEAPAQPAPTPTPPPPTDTTLPTETPTPEIQLSNLSPDPQRVEFQAQDGVNLVGYYFPSKYAEAEMVVLMHWAGGDKWDWCEIAPWLQNRQDENPAKLDACENPAANWGFGGATPWWDSSWFPPMPEDLSYAVFIFDFRDYGESDSGSGAQSELILDGEAAVQTVSGLPATALLDAAGKMAKPSAVDGFNRIWLWGSSIGASVVPFACHDQNQRYDAGGTGTKCAGFFSLSPGEDYAGQSYTAEVNALEGEYPDTLSICFASQGDQHSYAACDMVSSVVDWFGRYEYRDEHGNKLIDKEIMISNPELGEQPMNILEIILAYQLGKD